MKTAMMYNALAMLLPLYSRADLLDPTFGSVIFDLTNMNNVNLASDLALDAGASAVSVSLSFAYQLTFQGSEANSLNCSKTVAGLQELLTQSCNAITSAITDDIHKASFNGDQCRSINDLFSTSAAHAKDVLAKIDSLATAAEMSGNDAQTLTRVLQAQGPACDKAAAALDGACPKSADGNTENIQSSVDKVMQTAETDIQLHIEEKRRSLRDGF